MHTCQATAPTTPWSTWVFAFGLASLWLVYPLVSGPLALLRDFWSWSVLCAVALLWLRQPTPEAALLPALAWSLLLAAVANAGQGISQAYLLWRHVGVSDVYGFLHQRNQLATLCLMGLAATGWIYPRGKTSPRFSLFLRLFAWAVALLLGASLSLSASRTGLLGLVLLWGSAEAMGRHGSSNSAAKDLRTVLRWAVLGYGLALLPGLLSNTPALGILARQSAQEGVDVCSSRLSLWANVLELILQKPWLGWGWGELDFAHGTSLFQGERFCALLSNAHNLPLHLAVELGLPLAGVFCSLVLWGVWCGQPWREHNPHRLLAWSVLLTVGVHSLLEYPLWYGPFQVSTLLCLWTLVRTPRQTAPGLAAARNALPPATARNLQVALGLGLLATAFVAADYYRASQIYLQPAQRLGMYRDATQQQIQKSVFFQDVIDFARLGLTEVTADNAVQVHALALKMLHFSPEAMVLQKLLTATRLLEKQEEYDYYQQRFAAAYPDDFVQWKASKPGE